MKRFFMLLTAALLLGATGCTSDNDVDNNTEPQPSTITLDSSAADFTANGGAEEITFIASGAWSAEVINSRADGWCSVEPMRGEAGSGKITITTLANDTPDDRTASVIIKTGTASETVKVSQKQKNALTLTASRFEVSAEGGEVTIEIKANVDYEYVIDKSAEEWISYAGTRALKTSNLCFKVAQNEEVEKREGVITIRSGSLSEQVTIYQEGEKPAIVLSKSEYIVSAAGETIAVEVKSNVDVSVEIQADVDWISENTTRALSTNTYRFDIAENLSYDQRTAQILFTNKANNLTESVTVIQSLEDSIVKEILKNEREALIAIYNALDGENWTNNENWCSDKPVQEWYGVIVNNEGFIESLRIMGDGYNVVGSIPKAIGNLTKMKNFTIEGVLDSISEELYSCKELEDLYIGILLPEDFYEDYIVEDYPLTNIFSPKIGNLKRLKSIFFTGMFAGEIPAEIGECQSLEYILINGTYVYGQIPESLSNIQTLQFIDLCCNQLTGNLPTFSECKNLCHIELGSNDLTGTIPCEWGRLPLQHVGLSGNQLSGDIPGEWAESDFFRLCWPDIICGGNFNKIAVAAPDFYAVDINGNIITSDEEYAKNKYTIIVRYPPMLSYAQPNYYFYNYTYPQLMRIYEKYAKDGVEIIANGWFDKEDIRLWNFPWKVFLSTEGENRFYAGGSQCFYFPDAPLGTPLLAVIDETRHIVYDSLRDTISLLEFFDNEFSAIYYSSDYSQDGKVTALQTATVGEGIDVVLMGDGYSDRQIADGTYRSVMERAYNNLFTEEPYRSHKEYFNVYYVNAVSATEGYDYGNTAFAGYFGDGTLVGGDDNAVFTYAQKAISAERMDEALLVVMMNSENYAGTCYMYYPTSSAGYGTGVSVSYFPVGADEATFAELLHHEANGHGFSKLADEYAYDYMGEMPSDQVATYREQQSGWGWWQNVDFTSDAEAVLWARFLDDSRYAGEGLGLFEGGLTYWSGVWRPTENSIMRYNTGGFNAPSREAIYKRIHHLAYGDSWEYDYEEFVAWDAINRTEAAAAARRAAAHAQKGRYVRQMPAPPVVVGRSWREAK